MSAKPILVLEELTKSYESADGVSTEVLREVDLSLEAGESVAIVGPSGSGKSTLLNIAGTLDRPSTGKVSFEGTDLLRMSEKDISRFRNERIGFVFQFHHLLPQCTILENVLIPSLVAQKADGAEEYAGVCSSMLDSRTGFRTGRASYQEEKGSERRWSGLW